MSYGMHDYLAEKAMKNCGMRKEAGLGSLIGSVGKYAGKLLPGVLGKYRAARNLSNSNALKYWEQFGKAPNRIMNRLERQPNLLDSTPGSRSATVKSNRLRPIAEEARDYAAGRRGFINKFPNASYIMRSAPGVGKRTFDKSVDFVRQHPVGTGVSAAAGYGIKNLVDNDN